MIGRLSCWSVNFCLFWASARVAAENIEVENLSPIGPPTPSGFHAVHRFSGICRRTLTNSDGLLSKQLLFACSPSRVSTPSSRGFYYVLSEKGFRSKIITQRRTSTQGFLSCLGGFVQRFSFFGAGLTGLWASPIFRMLAPSGRLDFSPQRLTSFHWSTDERG